MRPDFGFDDDDQLQDEEQDLLVVLRLSNRLMGTNAEREAIEQFGGELEAAVLDAGVGEYDGDELGGGQCTLFFCGPDVDALIGVLRPLLHRSPLARGGHFERLVEGDDGELRRERVAI